jgi:hypothetical protein
MHRDVQQQAERIDEPNGRLPSYIYVAVREQAGAEASPTAAIVDSQSAKGRAPSNQAPNNEPKPIHPTQYLLGSAL